MKQGFVYIMTNKNLTTFYVGVTNDIKRRVNEHKKGYNKGFSYRYNLHLLVYYEKIDGIGNAIKREKQLKNWHRNWKLNLIKEMNPGLLDLSDGWYD